MGVFNIALLIFSSILIILSVLSLMNKMNEKSNYVRKNILLMFYFLGLSVLIVVLFSGNPLIVLLTAIPTTIIISITVYSVKRYRMLNIITTLLVLILVLHHYFIFFNVNEILFKG